MRCVPVDVFTGKQFDAEFLKLNPNAKVPVIVDPDGPGGKPYTCFESGAILLYLAEKTGKLLPADMAARYDAIQWLMTQMSTVGPMFGQYRALRPLRPGRQRLLQEPLSDPGEPCRRGDRERLGPSTIWRSASTASQTWRHTPWSRNIPALLGAGGERNSRTRMALGRRSTSGRR